MKKALMKDFWMEVRGSTARFLSIFFIVALGVAFFSGIQAASPDMRFSGDDYYDETKLMDMKIIATLGLTSEDVDALRAIDGIEYAEGGWFEDVLSGDSDSLKVVHIESLSSEFNLPSVQSGRLPEKSGECFLDSAFASGNHISVGDHFSVREDGDDGLLLKKEFEVVGTGQSPLYISFNRGNTTLGSGEINGFAYLMPEDFDQEVFTQIYIKVHGASQVVSYTDAYESLVDRIREKVENIESERCEYRYDSVVSEAREKLQDGIKELFDGKKEAEEELRDAREKLADGEEAYFDGLKEFLRGERQLEDARRQLADGREALLDGKKEVEDGKIELEDAREQLRSGYETLNSSIDQVNSGWDEISSAEVKLEEGTKELEDGKRQLADGRLELENGKAELESGRKELQEGKSQLAEGWKQLESGKQELEKGRAELEEGKAQLENGKQELAAAKSQVENGRVQLEQGEQTLLQKQAELDAGKAEITSARAQLEAGRQTLTATRNELESKKNQVNDSLQQIAAGEAQINSGRAELEAGRNTIEEQKYQLEAALEAGAISEEEYTSQMGNLSYAEAELHGRENELNAAAETLQTQRSALEGNLIQIQAGLEELSSQENALSAQEQQLLAAEQEISSGQAQIDAGWEELNVRKAELEAAEAEITASETQILESEAALTAGEEKLAENEKFIQATEAQLTENENKILVSEKEMEAAEQKISSSEAELLAAEAVIRESEDQIEAGKQEIQENKKKLWDAEAQIEAGREELEAGEIELKDGEQKLKDGEKEILDNEKILKDSEQTLKDGERTLEEAREDLLKGFRELREGQREYAKGKAEAYQEIAEAEEEIADAKKKIQDIHKPEWFITTRNDLPEYSDYGDNAERIRNLGKVFPVIFFLVAALISLTTMTRMVEDQRTQIGTMKALGYGMTDIASKYISYAFLATLGGSVLGVLAGEKVIPWVIIRGYGIMYHNVSNHMSIDYELKYAVLASGAALLCTVGATLFSCYKELAETPASLMRPPAPKEGKRILLERIPFLWKHMNFTWKSSMRNLFRYKKRFFMTIFGIAGSMGLMLVGFGLHDSIMDVALMQYAELQHYDGTIIHDEDAAPEELSELENFLKENEKIERYTNIMLSKMTATNGRNNLSAYVYVPENLEKFREDVTLKDRVTDVYYELTEDGAVICEKSASILGLSVGDFITVQRDNRNYQIPVSCITENYMGHYIYLTPSMYQSVFGEAADFTSTVFTVKEEFKEQTEEIGGGILGCQAALSISYTSSLAGQIDRMLTTLNMVVVVLIVSAGMLAFVVLYNLNNINITERQRELATLKVLGFYDGEVSSYVFRENIILTILGIAAGVFFGIALHRYTITTVEVDAVMFGRNIQPLSFGYCAVLTAGFSLLVNLFMHGKLKKINMVESLKSVE